MPPFLKFFFELGPLLVFFGAYVLYDYDLIIATKYLMVFSVISVAATYYFQKSVPKVLLYSTIALLALGSITLFTKNSSFIKMKPTVLYLIFAGSLFIGLRYNKIFLKNLLDKELPLNDQAWIIFSKRWGYFFLSLAIMNEVIWRTLPEILWIKFKVFGIIALIIAFTLSQVSFLSKNMRNK